MLHLYRRHKKSCKHTAWTYRRCQCPIHVKGTLAGTFIKKSLDLTSWDAAQKLIGDWMTAGKIGQLSDLSKSVDETVTAFMADAESRGLSKATIKKYRVLLEGRLLPWSQKTSTLLLSTLDLDTLSKFRATWPDAPLAKTKNTERLRAFFGWCVARGWLRANPATGLSAIKVPHNPTLPFTREEVSSILAACDLYPVHNSYGHDNRARMRAFVLLLRWSGLRISDVATLDWDAVHDGRVRLYTQKTGVAVAVPLPQEVLDSLAQLPKTDGHIFWSGKGDRESVVSNWQRALRTLFELAGVQHGHAHRFRDTFAVELLLSGVELADVSILLGHSSVKITERHYAPWVAARQTRLESLVQRSWQTEPVPGPIAPSTPDAPVPPPTPESASTDQTSPRPARTGTDDGPTPAIRPRLYLVPLP